MKEQWPAAGLLRAGLLLSIAEFLHKVLEVWILIIGTVAIALDNNQLCPGDERCQLLGSMGADNPVLVTPEHQNRHAQAWQDIPGIMAGTGF